MHFFNKSILAAAVILQALLVSGAAQAGSAMPTAGRASQPVGHYDFCLRYQAECGRNTGSLTPVSMTREVWAALIEVNNAVNLRIKPLTDLEMWGVEEYWSYPDNGVGDCEDYVLEKRRELMALGISASNLLITVVRQKNGAGHAVLTVRTSAGDFILDNLEGRVLAWNKTEYQYLKRQSERHAGIWTTIEDGRDLLVGSLQTRN